MKDDGNPVVFSKLKGGCEEQTLGSSCTAKQQTDGYSRASCTQSSQTSEDLDICLCASKQLGSSVCAPWFSELHKSYWDRAGIEAIGAIVF